MSASLFPEWDAHNAAPPPRTEKPWRPSQDQQLILRALTGRALDAIGVRELLSMKFKLSTVENHIEALVRHGYLRDTGERCEWTTRGRRIVWTAK